MANDCGLKLQRQVFPQRASKGPGASCGARIEVSKSDGKIVQSWAKPKKEKEGGDLIKAATERLKAEKEKRDKYLSSAKDMLV